MRSQITMTVNGAPIVVPSGATVAVAMAIAGQTCRTSLSGEPRGPVCGMGICFECRVVIDGKPHRPGCQILCEQGMDVNTDE
jgi:aerobic-type carbon monoxide dehydrogenase small subunit (CoxS/CutS family)